jgi:glycosyltransferase involved in cell wall biosynthesis
MPRDKYLKLEKTSIMKKRKPIVIVCPTSLGGHIEYSANLANSFSEMWLGKIYILSRAGAKRHTSGLLNSNVEVIESLPPLIKNSYPNVVKHFQKALRYGFLVNLIHPRVALFLHNIPADKVRGASQKLEVNLSLSTAKNADFVVVHGKAQEVSLRRHLTPRSVIQVPLPGVDTWAEEGLSNISRSSERKYLCLGEIRKNKNLELLVDAADLAQLPIKIIGRKTDSRYFEDLESLAARSDFCKVQEKFLSPTEFELELSTAYCLILPYGDFQAQSHVLAKALAFGTPVIVSDLPSLREQADNNKCTMFFERGNASSLAKVMKEFDTSKQICRPFSYQWSQVTSEILRGTGLSL